jgi:drug/metabolite transporter (DMT)-like permease
MKSKDSVKAYAAWLAVCFFWGTTYLAIRVAVESYPPALMAGVRFVMAGMILLPFLIWRGHSLPRRRELLDSAVVGIALLTVANGLVVWAEQWVSSGITALVLATLPFWVVAIEAVLPDGERIGALKIAGILIGFAGLLLLLSPDLRGSADPNYVKGILALLIAPLSWAAGSTYAKYRGSEASPLMAASFQMSIAGAVLIVIGILTGEHMGLVFDMRGFFAILYLLLFGSIVGYVCFIYALNKLPSTTVSLYAYINPVIAVILGKVVLDERLDWTVVAGTAVIFTGILLVQTASSR